MGIYLGGRSYSKVYAAGNEISELQIAASDYAPSSLLAIGSQIGNSITITVGRILIYNSTAIADGTTLVAEISMGSRVIDRQSFTFTKSTVPTITFSDGSVIALELFTTSNSFILLQAGTRGSAIGKTLRLYRSG